MSASEHRDSNAIAPESLLPPQGLERSGTLPQAGSKVDSRSVEHKTNTAHASDKNHGESGNPNTSDQTSHGSRSVPPLTVEPDFYDSHTAAGTTSAAAAHAGELLNTRRGSTDINQQQGGSSGPRESKSTSGSRQQRPSATRQDSRSHSDRHSHDSQTKKRSSTTKGSMFAALRSREDELEETERKIKDLERQLGKKEKALRIQERDFSELSADAEGLRDELRLKNSLIATLQGQHFETMKDTSSSKAQDDDWVRDKLKDCTNSWRLWAGRYALQDLNGVKPEERKKVAALFDGCSDQEPGQRISVDTSFPPEYANNAARLLLNASLAKLLCDAIVKHSFFCLEVGTPSGTYSIARDLEFVYQIAREEDPTAAHEWRSQTVQFFTKYVPRMEQKTASEPSHRREAWYRFLAEWFLNTEAQVLLRNLNEPESVERHDRLLAIIRDTGELFARLWTQKVWISTLDINEVKKERFNSQSKIMEPHVSYGLTGADESRFDGRRVQAVIQPAIVAYGNENGTDYERHKVWAKAVVLLGPVPAKAIPGRSR